MRAALLVTLSVVVTLLLAGAGYGYYILSSPDWATRPDLLEADHLSAQISLLDLFSGRVNILNFDARGVTVRQSESLAQGRNRSGCVPTGNRQ